MQRTLSLLKYEIQRPERLKWNFPSGGIVLDNVKSKSLKKFLRRSDKLLKDNELTVEMRILTKEKFLEWLPYYEAKMKEKEYDIFADEAWYDSKVQANVQVYEIFIVKGEQTIGSLLFSYSPQEAIIAFKANDNLDIFPGGRSSIGAVLDYFFLQHMVAEHVPTISAGYSRNAFGVINSIGNLDYKLRFGYVPQAAKQYSLNNELPLPEEGVVLFYGLKHQQLALYAFYPEGSSSNFEQERFATPAVPFIRVSY